MRRLRKWYYADQDGADVRHSPVEKRGEGAHGVSLDGEGGAVGPRSWYYNAGVPGDTGSLDFGELYKIAKGTILYRRDCGLEACGDVACCSSTGPDSYIFFLPGELEYQRKQAPSIPFRRVSPDDAGRLHCVGNEGCIYGIRPLDCRSYPYFPVVRNGGLVGYFDCRRSHACPLDPEVELRQHLQTIDQWWRDVLKREEVRIWAQETGACLDSFRIVGLPSVKED